MARKITRNIQKGKSRYDLLQDKSVKRFAGNATRLEHVNIKSKKNKSK
jgi:hypothetical protein